MIECHLFLLRRPAVLAGLTVALVLAGCGIKGPLERPPSAELAASERSEATKDSTTAKRTDASSTEPRVANVKSEKSKVQRVSRPGMTPPMTPEEWKKDPDRQSRSSKSKSAPEKPDEPFFLDKLL